MGQMKLRNIHRETDKLLYFKLSVIAKNGKHVKLWSNWKMAPSSDFVTMQVIR